jgi:hypothetical protein
MAMRDDPSSRAGDIQSPDHKKAWLVIGWFTPDYRPLASKLAASLDAHGAPYHLFAKDNSHGRWDVLRKPSIVLDAMAAYPDKTLVLMDVDCIVGGDIRPATQISGDVGVSVKARQSPWQRGIIITLGSRVVVFRPTEGARAFTAEWMRLCDQAKVGSSAEVGMAWAYVLRPDISYTHLDPRFAGREIGTGYDLDNIVIWHESEHEKGRRGSIKPVLKQIERRWFRSGRTKAALQKKKSG